MNTSDVLEMKCCPFCGTPKENGYLEILKCDVRKCSYVHCKSCGASAPIGIWNTRPPWLAGKDAIELIREVMQWHANPEATEYNECEKSPCRWCEIAKGIVAQQSNHSESPNSSNYPVIPDSSNPPDFRNVVLGFAKRMEAKLEKNRHKGDRAGWINDDVLALWRRMDQEEDELLVAMETSQTAEQIANEAADVANFAMMIADWYLIRAEKQATVAEPANAEVSEVAVADSTKTSGVRPPLSLD